MKLLRYILLSSQMLLFSALLSAQNNPLCFDSVLFDFGTIAEEQGVVTHDFRLRNNGTAPLVVVDVRANCGCTTFDYTNRPLLPDNEMTIRVEFNPQNQVGTIARKIYIRTSAADTVLMLRGNVVPRRRSASERCRLEVGGSLFLDSNAHDFGVVEQGTMPRSSFALYNGSDAVIRLNVVPIIESGFMDIRYPHELKPHEEAVIDFGYNVAENFYGTVNDIFAIDVNGKRSDVQLIMSGVAVDARRDVDINGAAKIELSKNFIKFGVLKRNSATKYANVDIRNTGTAPLHIRRIETQSGAVQLHFEGSKTIAAGESRKLMVAISPNSQIYGVVTDRIRIVSSDTSTPLRTLRVSAIIED